MGIETFKNRWKKWISYNYENLVGHNVSSMYEDQCMRSSPTLALRTYKIIIQERIRYFSLTLPIIYWMMMSMYKLLGDIEVTYFKDF